MRSVEELKRTVGFLRYGCTRKGGGMGNYPFGVLQISVYKWICFHGGFDKEVY